MIKKHSNETWLSTLLKISKGKETTEIYLYFISLGYTEEQAANYTLNTINKEGNMSNLETNTNRITLADALSATGFTQNGAPTNMTTFSKCLDFFFTAPMATKEDALSLWQEAFKEDPIVATKLSLWLRDPRNGAGKRESARYIFQHMDTLSIPTKTRQFWELIPTYGRYDDLLSLKDSANFNQIIKAWTRDIQSGNKLAAKWMPRERSSQKALARRIAKILGFSYKEYRTWLSRNTDVAETYMCANEWSSIIYSHLPSQCHNKNKKAFLKNDPNRYGQYVENVNSGSETVNTSTLWPHQVISDTITRNFSMRNNYVGFRDFGQSNERLNETAAEKMLWDNLPNWVDDCPTLVVCDTSGSMFGAYGSNVQPGVIAISLALYTAERLKGPYKDNFISFSREAKWIHADSSKSIAERVRSIPSIIENTNLQSVFDLVLKTAVKYHILPEDMPKRIMIISDMQFDNGSNCDETNFETIKRKYKNYGYEMPNLVFWNVSGIKKTFPVTAHESGTALISGYSPAIMKAIAEDCLSPLGVMFQAIDYINI